MNLFTLMKQPAMTRTKLFSGAVFLNWSSEALEEKLRGSVAEKSFIGYWCLKSVSQSPVQS